MKWILIAWILFGDNSGRSVSAIDVEFDSEQACQAAGQLLQEQVREQRDKDSKRFSRVIGDRNAMFICVPKGEVATPE